MNFTWLSEKTYVQWSRPSNPIQYLAAFLLKNDPYPPPQQIEISFDDTSKYATLQDEKNKTSTTWTWWGWLFLSH